MLPFWATSSFQKSTQATQSGHPVILKMLCSCDFFMETIVAGNYLKAPLYKNIVGIFLRQVATRKCLSQVLKTFYRRNLQKGQIC
jgi:hypothetical protein